MRCLADGDDDGDGDGSTEGRKVGISMSKQAREAGKPLLRLDDQDSLTGPTPILLGMGPATVTAPEDRTEVPPRLWALDCGRPHDPPVHTAHSTPFLLSASKHGSCNPETILSRSLGLGPGSLISRAQISTTRR